MKRKKASLNEIYAAVCGVTFAGVASYDEPEAEELTNLGVRAASLSYDIKTTLIVGGNKGIEAAAKEMLSFLADASKILQNYPDLMLKAPARGKQNSKEKTQETLGSVLDLVDHINEIFEREARCKNRAESALPKTADNRMKFDRRDYLRVTRKDTINPVEFKRAA